MVQSFRYIFARRRWLKGLLKILTFFPKLTSKNEAPRRVTTSLKHIYWKQSFLLTTKWLFRFLLKLKYNWNKGMDVLPHSTLLLDAPATVGTAAGAGPKCDWVWSSTAYRERRRPDALRRRTPTPGWRLRHRRLRLGRGRCSRERQQPVQGAGSGYRRRLSPPVSPYCWARHSSQRRERLCSTLLPLLCLGWRTRRCLSPSPGSRRHARHSYCASRSLSQSSRPQTWRKSPTTNWHAAAATPRRPVDICPDHYVWRYGSPDAWWWRCRSWWAVGVARQGGEHGSRPGRSLPERQLAGCAGRLRRCTCTSGVSLKTQTNIRM